MVGRLSAVRSQLSTLLGNYLGQSLLPHQGHTTFPKDSSYPVIDQSRKERPGSLGLPGTTKGPTQLQSLLWVREGLHWADTTVQLYLYPFLLLPTLPSPSQGLLLLFTGSVMSASLATPWTTACQTSLSFTISRSFLKLMSIESVMPSNYLVLCRPLLLLPSVFPCIRVFSNELALRIG